MRSLTATESAAALLARAVVRSLPRIGSLAVATGSSVSALVVLLASI